jgi:hypothetical protein
MTEGLPVRLRGKPVWTRVSQGFTLCNDLDLWAPYISATWLHLPTSAAL